MKNQCVSVNAQTRTGYNTVFSLDSNDNGVHGKVATFIFPTHSFKKNGCVRVCVDGSEGRDVWGVLHFFLRASLDDVILVPREVQKGTTFAIRKFFLADTLHRADVLLRRDTPMLAQMVKRLGSMVKELHLCVFHLGLLNVRHQAIVAILPQVLEMHGRCRAGRGGRGRRWLCGPRRQL